MPEFVPKTSNQILKDAVDYLYHNTNLSDFNVGSVIRTILEVMAVEDAEQYFQMFSILESFFLRTATGSALDDRAKEYNVTRLPASPSVGEVVFLDTNLKKSFLISSVTSTSTVLYVEDAAEFPVPPFLVQMGEGSQVEQVQIKTVTLSDNSLTIQTDPAIAAPPFNAVSYDHPAAGTGVSEFDNLTSMVTLFDSVQPAKVIPSGVTLRAQPTNVTYPIECLTTEVGTHPAGYFVSNPVKVKSTSIGVDSNVPAQRLNQISGGSPYSGAAVVNKDAIAGGKNAELDSALRERIRNRLAALPKGTITAISTNLIGTTHSESSQIVSRVKVVEDFTHTVVQNPGYATVYAYVDDSNISFSTSEERHPSATLTALAPVGATTLSLNNTEGFTIATTSNKPYIIIDPGGNAPFVTNYQAIVNNVLTNLVPPTLVEYPPLTVVSICEDIDVSVEHNKKYYQTDKYPIGDDLFRLFKTAPGSLGALTEMVQLLPGGVKTFDVNGTLVEDFILNEALGQIEFFDEKIPPEGSSLFAIYENFTGLIKKAQTVVDGSLFNLRDFPGVRSAGVKVLVRPSKRELVNIHIDLSVNNDLTSSGTANFLVQQVLISYVNNLNIGEDVIVAELIDRAMSIFGVTNCKVLEPAGDRTINHDSVAYVADIVIV